MVILIICTLLIQNFSCQSASLPPLETHPRTRPPSAPPAVSHTHFAASLPFLFHTDLGTPDPEPPNLTTLPTEITRCAHPDGRIACIRRALEQHGCDIRHGVPYIDWPDAAGNKAILAAIRCGCLRSVQFLLRNRFASIAVKSSGDLTTLMCALAADQYDVFSYLINALRKYIADPLTPITQALSMISEVILYEHPVHQTDILAHACRLTPYINFASAVCSVYNTIPDTIRQTLTITPNGEISIGALLEQSQQKALAVAIEHGNIAAITALINQPWLKPLPEVVEQALTSVTTQGIVIEAFVLRFFDDFRSR